jgi:hypothetical protein
MKNNLEKEQEEFCHLKQVLFAFIKLKKFLDIKDNIFKL